MIILFLLSGGPSDCKSHLANVDMTCVSPKLEVPRRGGGEIGLCVWQLVEGGEGEWMASGYNCLLRLRQIPFNIQVD